MAVEASTPLPALGSSAQLREVLANIILNAVQAMPGGGTIGIRAERIGATAVISVADTGTGMSEETKRRIFDPFFTTRGREGTGLGLSIADAIISKHGGAIAVESEPGRGATMTVRLPLVQDATDVPDCAKPTGAVRRSAEVLVVDDDKMFGTVIGQMLEEEGHTAAVFSEGSDALKSLQGSHYDILITDLAMSGMRGTELAKAARLIDPDISVVLMTGFASAADSPEIAASGIDCVLDKPVDHDELMRAVARALDREQQRAEAESREQRAES